MGIALRVLACAAAGFVLVLGVGYLWLAGIAPQFEKQLNPF